MYGDSLGELWKSARMGEAKKRNVGPWLLERLVALADAKHVSWAFREVGDSEHAGGQKHLWFK